MKNKFGVLLVSVLISLMFFLIGLSAINDFGETTDEKFDQNIGEWYLWDWPTKGITGLNDRFIPLQRNYGPFFDKIVVSSFVYFSKEHQILKPVASYHLPVLIVSSLALFIVFWLSYQNWGFLTAVISSLTLGSMPRFIGDSQNNLKDTPLMTLFAASVLGYFMAINTGNIIIFIIAGVLLGLTYTIKINGLIIIPVIGLWYLLNHSLIDLKGYVKFGIKFLVSLIAAFLTILTVWPYYRYEPAKRFIETYLTFKDHVWNEKVLYLGQLYRGQELPWHFPFVMLGVTLPTAYLLLFLGAVVLSARLIIKDKKYRKSLSLLLLWFVFPPVVQILSGAPMYDGIRHYLISLPPMAMLIAFTIYYLTKKLPSYRWHILIVWVIIFGFIIKTNIRFHPYEIVYFNSLAGGVSGAYYQFDLDYWGQSLKEAAEWVNNNLPDGSRIMLAVPMDHHFPVDRSRFQLVRENPDYKVSLIRGMLDDWDPLRENNYLYPSGPPIYSIVVDGGTILRIFKI